MVLNKQGQVGIILGLMLFVFAFAIAVSLSAPMKELTGLARDSGHLDCDNESVSTGVSATCVGVDLVLPLFILTVIAVGATMLIRSSST